MNNFVQIVTTILYLYGKIFDLMKCNRIAMNRFKDYISKSVDSFFDIFYLPKSAKKIE